MEDIRFAKAKNDAIVYAGKAVFPAVQLFQLVEEKYSA